MTIPENNSINNIERFSGFEDVYDQYRPTAPSLVVDILSNYLQKKPGLVVDVGCGTGLSSFIWRDRADRIIGVEPNQDMLNKARYKLSLTTQADHLSFEQGYSNQLSLDSNSTDIVTCSQSFHWMEPKSTLKEIARVLVPGGIFAAYDCDWPPTVNWQLEREYINLLAISERIIAEQANPEQVARKRDKDNHLQQIEQSGHFRFTKEIVFHHIEPCSAERYVGILLSQGGIQAALKLNSDYLKSEIQIFQAMADDYFRGGITNVMFSYRLRVGIR